jgi:hypothetical protein
MAAAAKAKDRKKRPNFSAPAEKQADGRAVASDTRIDSSRSAETGGDQA